MQSKDTIFRNGKNFRSEKFNSINSIVMISFFQSGDFPNFIPATTHGIRETKSVYIVYASVLTQDSIGLVL